MKQRSLTYKSIAYFARFYRLVAIAVLIMVTVIVGSLVVGDSVRTTLVKRVTERLGDTQTIIFSRNSFMADQLLAHSLFEETARGILLVNGFISQNGKLIPVFVWGVDDLPIGKGGGKLNEALLSELGESSVSDIVLRLPATGLVPSGSLFVTENYTTSIRLSYEGVVGIEEGGNISMKDEQVIPYNLFLNRKELAEALNVEDKVNLILDKKLITDEELNDVWDYTASGLSVNKRDGFMEIVSDRVFLQDQVVDIICRENATANRIFSYLANAIERKEASIPYSFVTAMDRYGEETLSKEEVILSDYSAKRLQVQVGDTVRMSFFTSADLKTLAQDTIQLRVKQIVPLAELSGDKTLSAEFPGLSDVERCTDWDSDLPINMDLITKADEAYWELYRSTPKAIISYEAVGEKWGNAYGNATSIRVTNDEPELSQLRAEMFGIQVIHPLASGLLAAKNGVDFSELFLALGFFIIVSAALQMLTPLSEMLYQRRGEIALLKALGYRRKRIIQMLWRESAPVVLVSSIIGVLVGLLYTSLIMWLLGNVWKGATHTDGFAVYPSVSTLLIGLLVGILLSLGLLFWAIVRSLKERAYQVKQGKALLQRKKGWAIGASALSIIVIGVNFLFLQSATLFVVVGIILIGTAALWGEYRICRKGSADNSGLRFDKLIWGTLYANKKQAVLSFFALAIGVFIVFSVGLNRKGFADSTQIQTGTGGYSLWCESSVPIFHNMATNEGREKLSLTDLPPSTEILQCLRYSATDASCLNLNKVSNPTVLGVNMNDLASSDFQIDQTIFHQDREGVFRQMEVRSDTVYPAFIDATVLTWGLMMNLGDTLHYENDRGETVAIQLVGTLSNSIFQGHILVDRKLFSEIWKETTGSEVMLFKTAEADKEQVKTLLSQALHEYGVIVSTTNDRLRQFNSVTDTYLTIFMTLGGLGLLLGIMSFIIVIRKNLLTRRREINLYRTLGFTDNKIEKALYTENLIVPFYAIGTGVISSLAGVSMSVQNASVWLWLMALVFTVFFVIGVIVFVRLSVRNEIQNSKRFIA